MLKVLKSSTDNRKWYVNLIICISILLCSIFFPSLFRSFFSYFIGNEIICVLLSYICIIIILFLIFYNDLIEEFKNFRFSACFSIGFKYYFVGLMAMVFFNLILANILGGVSSNENQVRELLFHNPAFMLICICILGPIQEELIYRKSIQPVIKNKFVYAFVCGLIFGLAHLTTNFFSGTFVLGDLLYILPYGSLGFVFACMDYETKCTYTSIMMHCIHNTFTGVLLLLFSSLGVL